MVQHTHMMQSRRRTHPVSCFNPVSMIACCTLMHSQVTFRLHVELRAAICMQQILKQNRWYAEQGMNALSMVHHIAVGFKRPLFSFRPVRCRAARQPTHHMPSVPIEMASLIPMVLKRKPTMPTACTPSLTSAARSLRCMLHGLPSHQTEEIPICTVSQAAA